MQDLMGMALSEGIQHGSHVIGDGFFCVGSLADNMVEFTTLAPLHDDVDVVFIFPAPLEMDNAESSSETDENLDLSVDVV